ncbi:MAG: hypothetical protein WEG40_02290 [Candidatus Rokuibacteriota bacterium]
MALSAKMLAVLQKVDAARAEFFAGLRESAKQEAQVRVEKKKRMTNAKKKPPMKMPPPRATSMGGATDKQRKDRKGSPRPPKV